MLGVIYLHAHIMFCHQFGFFQIVILSLSFFLTVAPVLSCEKRWNMFLRKFLIVTMHLNLVKLCMKLIFKEMFGRERTIKRITWKILFWDLPHYVMLFE